MRKPLLFGTSIPFQTAKLPSTPASPAQTVKLLGNASQKLQVAPPVYQPRQIPNAMQRKISPTQNKLPGGTPPPAYRPEQIRSASPKSPSAKMMPPKTGTPMTMIPTTSSAENQTAIQRFIAKGTTVYYPNTITFTAAQSKDNFERSLKVLGGPPQTNRTVTQISWSDFAKDHAQYELSAMGSPTGGRNQKKVKKQFEDQTTVYYYRSNQEIQSATPASKHLLLSFADMAEKNDDAPLPESDSATVLANAKCVIEILRDWAIPVPQTTTTTISGWHNYSRGLGLDYRQDNHYIVLYVQKLGYPLINNKPVRWNDWNPAIGRYLVTSQDRAVWSGTGHMIGVTVTAGPSGGRVKTITDTQGLSPGTARNRHGSFDNFKVCYIFQVP